MNRDRVKRVYDLHAWTGVIFGLFIYVVSLSGVFALFGAELASWEDETLRIAFADDPAPAMPILSGFMAEVPKDASVLNLSFDLPTAARPVYAATAVFRAAGERKVTTLARRWNPNTGTLLPDRGHGLVHWLVDFHRNLMLERTLGRALVGLSGVFLPLLILSGLVTHRKMLREALTWRLDRSVRLKWQDSHKAIGLWGVPFHLMIAFTGAWLGLIAILLPITAAISFKGDTGAVIAALGPPPHPAAGIAAPMIPVDDAVRAVQARVGVAPVSVSIRHWGDRNAVYVFSYPPARKLLSAAQAHVNAATGEITAVKLASKPGLTHRIPTAMTTLHYARFGGLWMKLLYTVLGLLLCVVTATGLMMWLERRLHGNAGRCPATCYRALGRVTVGVCTGMALASVAIFHADRLSTAAPADRIAFVGTVYFAVWATGLLYALIRKNEYRSCKELLAATGVLALAVPVTNAAATGQTLLDLIREGHSYAAGTDIAAIALGGVLFLLYRFIPSQRPAKVGRAPYRRSRICSPR